MRVSGRAYIGDGRFKELTHTIEDGDRRWSSGFEADADKTGLLLPPLLNCHSHIGDWGLRNDATNDFDEMLAPGTGLKFKHLEEVPHQIHVMNMFRAIDEMRKMGIIGSLDFREGGKVGLDRAHEVLESVNRMPGPDFDLRLLGRDEPIEVLAEHAFGLGVSSIEDDPEAAEKAAAVHAKGGFVAVHASESRREEMAKVIELDPQLVIHLCHASDDDFRDLAATEAVVCVCPRSNERFGLPTALPRLVEHRIPFVLGTDNAFVGPMDVIADLKVARRLLPDLPEDVWFKVLFDFPAYLFGRQAGLPETPAIDQPFMLLPELPGPDVPGA